MQLYYNKFYIYSTINYSENRFVIWKHFIESMEECVDKEELNKLKEQKKAIKHMPMKLRPVSRKELKIVFNFKF